MASPSIFAVDAGSSEDSALVSVNVPAHSVGQLLKLFVVGTAQLGETLNIQTPAGWTIDGTQVTSLNQFNLAGFWKAGDGTTTQVNVDMDGICEAAIAVLVVLDNAAQTSPIDGYATNFNEGQVHDVNSITTGQNDSLVFELWNFRKLLNEGVRGSAPDSPVTEINLEHTIAGGTPSALEMVVRYLIKNPAGATGAKTIFSTQFWESLVMTVGVKRFAGPSIPSFIQPTSSSRIVVGSQYKIKWNQATHPTLSQSALQYELQYSKDGGLSWTTITALTSAGVGEFTWNTTGLTTGTNYKLRIRAWDGTTFSLNYAFTGTFHVVVETTPAAPVITAPTSGQALDKAVNVDVNWLSGGGQDNPQTEFTLQWSRDGFASHTVTVGPTVTANETHALNLSGEADGANISVKVKTKGVSLYSAYSAVRTFVVASLPATPTNLLPSSVTPPTEPFALVTYSAGVHSTRRWRIIRDGAEVHNTGFVGTGLGSFTAPYPFLPNQTVTHFLAVANQWGLQSAETSQTLTPTYVGPAEPDLTVLNQDASGTILASILNSDSPTHNQLLRHWFGQRRDDAMLVGNNIPIDGQFTDGAVPQGAVPFYIARAVNSATGLFTDSELKRGEPVVLAKVFVHVVSRTSVAGNADGGIVLGLSNRIGHELVALQNKANQRIAGRELPLPIAGKMLRTGLKTNIIIPLASEQQLLSLIAAQESRSMICVRDQFGNRLFGFIDSLGYTQQSSHYSVNFFLQESYYIETLSGSDSLIEIPTGRQPLVSGIVPLWWLSAQRERALVDGAAVPIFYDSSGYDNHALQATGADQPLLKRDIVNGQSALRFDGTSEYLKLARNGIALSEYTVLAVFRLNSAITTRGSVVMEDQTIEQGGSTPIPLMLGFGLSAANGHRQFGFYSTVSGFQVVGDGQQESINEWVLYIGIKGAAGSLKFYRNGTLLASGTGTNFADDTGNFFIARRSDLSSFSPIDLAELQLYPAALTDAQREAVESYLNHQYGLF